MQKLAVVVLNYNDYQNTKEQVERILHFSCINHIIVVDNCSKDGSGERLRKELPIWNEQVKTVSHKEPKIEAGAYDEEDKVILVEAAKNGGYGAGNNLGMRRAAELEMTHILIANPDTSFSEELVEELLHCFESDAERTAKKTVSEEKGIGRDEKDRELCPLAVLSTEMQDASMGLQQTAWPLRSFLGELLNSGPLSRRLFRRFLNYPESYLKNASGRKTENYIPVGAVHGSLLMLSVEAFLKTGGYDEKVFLYCEENILAYRIREAGFRSGYLPGLSYLHEGGGSTKKSYSGMLPKQKLRQRSERYYYEHYLHIGTPEKLLCLLFQGAVLLETALMDGWMLTKDRT